MSQLFAWGGKSTGVSALASFLQKNIQGWSPSEWTGWISLQSKGLSRVFFNITLQNHQFCAQLSLQSNSHIHTWLFEKPKLSLDEPLQHSNVSAFYYAVQVGHSFSSKEQASLNFMAAVTICSDFGAPKIKSLPPNKVSIVFPSICHEVMGLDAMIFIYLLLSFKPAFYLSSFTFIKRLFSSSLSAIRVVSSAYMRLRVFLLAILIPACASSSPEFYMMTISKVTIYSLDVLLSQFGTCLLFHVQF